MRRFERLLTVIGFPVFLLCLLINFPALPDQGRHTDRRTADWTGHNVGKYNYRG